MQGASSQPPVDSSTDLPTTQDANKPHTASEQTAAAVEAGPAENLSQVDEKVLNAQERDKGDDSKFWTTYDTVSKEYDKAFLSRADGDMNIILTFAGLFSAVNSTFIIGMQPNPGETTNVLLLHLIQITANPSAVHDISNLSSSTGYPPPTVWMQTLAYASLSFSVLAAFGAVLGKQWLNAYKAARGQGSLQERGMRRQKKLDGLEDFHLQTVLQTFLVLLQISLLLFGLSLSANMWIQQTTISSVIICTTAFGILFYACTILVSRLYLDSPFQTPGSEVVGAICNKILAVRDHFHPDKPNTRAIWTRTPDDTLIKLSAIHWILNTSTNPEFVEAAAGMVPLVQWPRGFDISAIFTRFRDIFEACGEKEEVVFVKCGKAMAHLCTQSLEISRDLRRKSWFTLRCWGGTNRFIRDAFTHSRSACKQRMNTRRQDDRKKHKADARTALRTLIVHGLSHRFSLPDDEDLIWHGDLRWCRRNGLMPICEEFDWLIDYLVEEAESETDDETLGDALLALSAMRGLGSSTKRRSYVRALIRCMGPTRPHRVRHAALRAVSDARAELSSITMGSMPEGVDAGLLDELSGALSTAVCPNPGQTIPDNTQPDASFHSSRDRCYARLIFALTMNDEWRERLTNHGHLERCASLIEQALGHDSWDLRCYLAGIYTCIDPSDKVLSSSFSQERLWTCVRTIWNEESPHAWPGVLPDLVTVTRQYLRGDNSVPKDELSDLASDVHEALKILQQIKGISVRYDAFAQADVDVALSSVQGLYDHLHHMVENLKSLQKTIVQGLEGLEGNDHLRL